MTPPRFRSLSLVRNREGASVSARSELKRGWRVLAGSFLGIGAGVTSLYFYSLGVFIKPLAASFGWGRGEASLGALVGTACAAIIAIPMGRLVDRFGSRSVATASLVLLAAGFASLAGLTSGLGSFLVLTALLSLLAAGSGPLPYTRLIVATFERRRGVALGIALAGVGFGAILTPALLTPFVAAQGWRAGYLLLATVVASAAPLVWWFLRDAARLEAVRAEPTPLAQMVGNSTFQLLAAIFFLASTAILGSVVQFVPMLMDSGLSPARAGLAAALIGVSTIAARLMTGALLDRFPAFLVACGIMAAAALGLVLLALGGVAVALPGALVIGLAVGSEVDLIAFLVGRHFPKSVYGQFYGAVYAVFLLGAAIGPAVSGYLREATGDYRAWLFVAAGLLVLASACALMVALRRQSAGAPLMAPAE